MAVETIAYFTVGGVFTGIYSNAVRQFPLLRRKLPVHLWRSVQSTK